MALKYLRDNLKHLKWVLWFVVIVFVLLVFVDWGTGRQRSAQAGVAVQVGDHVVSEQQFLRQLRDNERRYQSLYGAQWQQVREQINLAEQTAQEIIQRQLLAEEASEAGLEVSEAELQQQILAVPAFHREDGAFVGADLYERILRANQTSPDEFERKMRQDLLIDKLRRTVEGGVVVGPGEVETAVRKEKESADFDLIRVPVNMFVNGITADDAEVAAYYAEHSDDYRHEDQRVLRYLLVDSNALRRLLPVDDAAIAAYYQEHQADFRQGEQASARHILLRVTPGASPEDRAKAKVKADAVAKLARSGADFAELAKLHSEDPGSKDKGGDLGWFGRGRMVKEFDEAVFGHKPGEIVGPIESQFGYHIIKVEGFRPARQRPLAEVKEEVRFRLLESRAAGEAQTRAVALARRLKQAKDDTDEAWQKVADEDEAVSLNVTPPFGADEVIPGIGENPELRTAAFAAAAGGIGDAVPTNRGWIVWQVKEVRPAGVPPLDEVRDQVATKVVRAKGAQLAMEKARRALTTWQSGGEAAAVASGLGGSVVPVRNHRHLASLPGIGVAPQVDAAVFSTPDGALFGPLTVGDHDVVIGRVIKAERLTAEEVAAESTAVRKRLLGQRANELLQAIVGERRRAVVVTVNNELMERFAPKGQSRPAS